MCPSLGVCALSIYPSECVCKAITDLEALVTFPSHPAPQTPVGLMVLVPLRSMQISSPVFRHERLETTNRNRREAALTPPRLLQEKKKETRG